MVNISFFFSWRRKLEEFMTNKAKRSRQALGGNSNTPAPPILLLNNVMAPFSGIRLITINHGCFTTDGQLKHVNFRNFLIISLAVALLVRRIFPYLHLRSELTKSPYLALHNSPTQHEIILVLVSGKTPTWLSGGPLCAYGVGSNTASIGAGAT
jgi:hypothetical protein